MVAAVVAGAVVGSWCKLDAGVVVWGFDRGLKIFVNGLLRGVGVEIGPSLVDISSGLERIESCSITDSMDVSLSELLQRCAE